VTDQPVKIDPQHMFMSDCLIHPYLLSYLLKVLSNKH